ncbi:metal ABC transporter permease [Schaalia suimastitidis]|uniref:metal ABC transporter permease n=1 Tax=Schaalia suimastitidis TaxID=121163 RepID=UPI0003FEE46F|nr:metal ABC transporter permease [Schaalia suimastitidis]
MTAYAFGVLTLMVVTVIACAIPGAFLVTSRQSMLVDAMSHAALPGIVLAALVWPIGSPMLTVGATAMALVVVFAAQAVTASGIVPKDAAQGLLFPGLFSIGVVLLSTHFSHLHLHEDAVLVGDPNIVAVIPLEIGSFQLGPSYAWVMAGVALVNAVFVAVTHRQLALVVFDEHYAKTLGIPVTRLKASAMVLVALTLTAAFHAAGAVLVIAFVVVPAAIAVLFAQSFARTVIYSVLIGVAVVIPSFFATYWGNRPTSSWTAFVLGAVFVLSVAFQHIRSRRTRTRLRQAA